MKEIWLCTNTYGQAVYMCVYIYIYMFICTELFEQTGRPLVLILAFWDIFGLARRSSSVGKISHIDGVMT